VVDSENHDVITLENFKANNFNLGSITIRDADASSPSRLVLLGGALSRITATDANEKMRLSISGASQQTNNPPGLILRDSSGTTRLYLGLATNAPKYEWPVLTAYGVARAGFLEQLPVGATTNVPPAAAKGKNSQQAPPPPPKQFVYKFQSYASDRSRKIVKTDDWEWIGPGDVNPDEVARRHALSFMDRLKEDGIDYSGVSYKFLGKQPK
jgi:hypothetical protein